MEIVNFGKLGLDHRFCRELAGSIAKLLGVGTRVGSRKGFPNYRYIPVALSRLQVVGAVRLQAAWLQGCLAPGPLLFLCPSVAFVLIQLSTGWAPLSLLAMIKCSFFSFLLGAKSVKTASVPCGGCGRDPHAESTTPPCFGGMG